MSAVPFRPIGRFGNPNPWRRTAILCFALSLSCVATLLASVAYGVGSVTLTPSRMWVALFEGDHATRLEIVATNARMARVTLAFGAGVVLAAAGALLQALYRNPLAAPEVTGVTQGASAAVVFWIVWGPDVGPDRISWVLPVVAAAGGTVAGLGTWSLSRLAGRVDPMRMILMGVLVGGCFAAVTSIALLESDEQTQEIVRWLSGSLAMVTWHHVRLFLGAALVALPILLLAIPQANALQLGDEVATGIGIHTARSRLFVLITAAVLTASAVCVVGGIGFVGLVAPHLVRRATGSDLRRLVPTAALAGGCMVMIADFLSRNVRSREIEELTGIPLNVAAVTLPVGVYLALFGAPIFLFLMRRSR